MSATIKAGDVFNFRYTDGKERFMPNHCFDGQLIAVETPRGLLLADTYWTFGKVHSDSGRVFNEQEAREQGELTFVCNLSEVEDIKDGTHYYADKDVFDLSHQHGCYKKHVKRKGALRSRERMLQKLYSDMQEAHRQVASAARSVEFTAKRIQQVEGAEDDELGSLYI